MSMKDPPYGSCPTCNRWIPANPVNGEVGVCSRCANSERERNACEPCAAGEPCPEHCDHSDTDDYSCLDCGKELAEDRMAAAYDAAKASRQDGDT